MADVVRISEAASLGMHAMALLATHPMQRWKTNRMAELMRVSEAHLSKVLQRLSRAGLVQAVRGPGGGFTLTRPQERITLLEVFEAVEGPMTEPGCLLGLPRCGGKACIFGDLLASVSRRVRRYMANKTLAQVAPAFVELATCEEPL
jgi:Rrf2 family protein